MKRYKVHLESAAPICFGAYINEVKPRSESHDEFEKRTWRQRANVNEKGEVVITPFAVKNMLDAAAARMGMRTGKGTKTFKSKFETGVMVLESIVLPFTRENIPGEWRMVPSDGKPAAYSKGGRVPKCFPKIDKWEGEVIIDILDESITPSVLEEHLKEAGQFIGLGSHRVQNRGIYGRFTLKSLEEVAKA